MRVIDNSTDFHEKVNRLCNGVFDVLGIPTPLEIERKFLIKRPPENILKSHNAQAQKIIQAYLPSRGNTERRVRARGNENGFTYFYTEKQSFSPLKRIEKERKISQHEYMSLLAEARHVLTKTRWCFLHQGQYFELDIFDSNPNQALLEIELTDEKQSITLPDWCQTIQEVTQFENYRNSAIAEKGFPKITQNPPPQKENNFSA